VGSLACPFLLVTCSCSLLSGQYLWGEEKRENLFFLFPLFTFHFLCVKGKERSLKRNQRGNFLFLSFFFPSFLFFTHKLWSASSFTLNKLECSKQANHFAIE